MTGIGSTAGSAPAPGPGPVASLPSEGRLEGVSVPELVRELNAARHTGALLLARGDVRKVLYFREGRVTFAASTDAEDRLGPFLFRRGEVELAPLLEAGLQVMPGRRLGQILIGRRLVEPPALVRAVLDQVREIALSVFPWSDGHWRISRAALAAEESITLDVATEELILAGVRRVRDGGRVRRCVGGPRAVYEAVPHAVTPGGKEIPGLGMTERAILDELRAPRRVDRLCGEVFAPSEVVFRSLWALSILGLVQRTDPRTAVPPIVDGSDGFLADRGGLPDLLLDLGDRKFTGALRVYNDGREAALFLRDGLVEFARTNDQELSLAAHLLRRGIISDRDRDEAVRRLVSGKRIGTILAEQGAVDVQDLKRFVREQVLEVVRRVVLYDDGEYELDAGETVEESVVLSRAVEDVVMAAYESLEGCQRIWREVGDLDTVYRLRPEYLARLDRMSLRPGIWELVSSLGRERTLRELLSSRPESDFDVCRWLCGLVRVRVVERTDMAAARPPMGIETIAITPGTLPALKEAAAEEPHRAPASASDIAPELFPPRPAAEQPVFTPSDDAIPWRIDVVDTPEPPRSEPMQAPRAAPAVDAAAQPSDPAETAELRVSWPLAAPEEVVAPAPAPPAPPKTPPAHPEAAAESAATPQFQLEDVGESAEPPPLPQETVLAVERFNRRHRVLYEGLRREIGAGVRNFVLTCQRRLGPLGAPFEGLTPDKNGVFDAQLLGRYLASAWTGAPAQPLDALIAEEMALVRTLLEPSRLAAIEEALAAVS